MLDSGRERDELLTVFEDVHEQFRETGEEQFADFALDGMDFLAGWCGLGLEIAATGAV